jgi:hypothetical protein
MAAASSLLAPGVPVLADDLTVAIRSFRCYDGTSDSYFGMFVQYSAPSPGTFYGGSSIVARERSSDSYISVQADAFDQPIPSLYAFNDIRPGRYRSMRGAVAGTEDKAAQVSESRAEDNCEVIGDDDDDDYVKLHVVCARSGANYRAHAVADIINQEMTATEAIGSLTLLGRRSGGDFQELQKQDFNQYLPGLSVGFQHAADNESDLRRVRAEVEFQFMGSNDTIREREEADCD